jgi:hypothetical protein
MVAPAIELTRPATALLPKALVVNLVMLLVLGVVLCGWVLAYTDWFPVVGGLLSLGGIFSWLAFVSRMLTGDITKQFQEGFVATLSKKRLSAVLFIIALLLAVASSFFGVIRVQALPSSQINGFNLYREGSSDPEPQSLGTDGSSNVLVPTVFGHSSWRIKVPGYPYEPVDVYPLQRLREYLPTTQRQRRVLLIVPSEEILSAHNTEKITLVVDLGDGKQLTIPEYSWFAFWVGCAADVKVPAPVQAELRTKFPKGKRSSLDVTLDAPWSDPTWLPHPAKPFDLEFPVRTVTLTLKDSDGKERLKRSVIVRDEGATFVQLEYLANEDWKSN